MAIVDATRSIAAQSLQLTRLGEWLETYAPTWAKGLNAFQLDLIDRKVAGWPLSKVIDYFNAIPVALLAAALFLLMYTLASRNRAPRHF